MRLLLPVFDSLHLIAFLVRALIGSLCSFESSLMASVRRHLPVLSERSGSSCIWDF